MQSKAELYNAQIPSLFTLPLPAYTEPAGETTLRLQIQITKPSILSGAFNYGPAHQYTVIQVAQALEELQHSYRGGSVGSHLTSGISQLQVATEVSAENGKVN